MWVGLRLPQLQYHRQAPRLPRAHLLPGAPQRCPAAPSPCHLPLGTPPQPMVGHTPHDAFAYTARPAHKLAGYFSSHDASPPSLAPCSTCSDGSGLGVAGAVYTNGAAAAALATVPPAPVGEGKIRCSDMWFLTSVLGAGSTRSTALGVKFMAQGYVPLFSIAAMVSRDGSAAPSLSGQVLV